MSQFLSDQPRTIALSDLVPRLDGALLSAITEVSVDAALRQAIAGSGRIRARVAARVATELELEPRVDGKASSAVDLLAMGTTEAVNRMLMLAGALSAVVAIRHVVTRDAVARLQTVLGQDIYALALSQDGTSHGQGSVPQTSVGARAAGLACLGRWLAVGPEPLSALLVLRFDATDRAAMNQIDGAETAQCIDDAARLLEAATLNSDPEAADA